MKARAVAAREAYCPLAKSARVAAWDVHLPTADGPQRGTSVRGIAGVGGHAPSPMTLLSADRGAGRPPASEHRRLTVVHSPSSPAFKAARQGREFLVVRRPGAPLAEP